MLSCHFPAARILLVEDDPLLACHMRGNLQARGYNVSLSQDGREGLRLASSGAFDLVLLDILLPGISGLQALQHLRERLGVPVILVLNMVDVAERNGLRFDGATVRIVEMFLPDNPNRTVRRLYHHNRGYAVGEIVAFV